MKRLLAIGIILLFVGMSASSVVISIKWENQPPGKPVIDGPTSISPGTYDWTFKAEDPDGDDIFYQIYWGDGNPEDWIGAFEYAVADTTPPDPPSGLAIVP